MLKQLLTAPLHWLLPASCLSCHAPVAEQGGLCASCFNGLSFLTGSLCYQCGLPFALPMESDTRCPTCLSHPPAFDRARAVCRYDDASRPLITRLKYSDHLHLAPALARWMKSSGLPLLAESSLILPVPLHYRRQIRRMHNQSALLASRLSRLSGVPWHGHILTRIKHTVPQASLTRSQRATNVTKAFSVPEASHPLIQNATLTLVDDVMTTGATLNACARTLKQAGAGKVHVLTFARTCLD